MLIPVVREHLQCVESGGMATLVVIQYSIYHHNRPRIDTVFPAAVFQVYL